MTMRAGVLSTPTTETTFLRPSLQVPRKLLQQSVKLQGKMSTRKFTAPFIALSME